MFRALPMIVALDRSAACATCAAGGDGDGGGEVPRTEHDLSHVASCSSAASGWSLVARRVPDLGLGLHAVTASSARC